MKHEYHEGPEALERMALERRRHTPGAKAPHLWQSVMPRLKPWPT